MPIFKFADLVVEYYTNYDRLTRNSEPYKTGFEDNPDISIIITEEYMDYLDDKCKRMSREECEYFFTGQRFYYRLLDFGGIMLHASAVMMDNQAYLFTAPSGVGKSTHTALWQKIFGSDRAKIINDDKPAIRKMDGKFYAYGTPFSGTSDLNLNVKVPLKAICILERGEENAIERVNPKDHIYFFMSQTIRPKDQRRMDLMLDFLNDMLENVPVYKMKCNMNSDAAVMAYKKMK